MYLVPPMAGEPPADFVAFVDRHAAVLRAEAYRLVGGAPVYEELYLAVLTDLAGHWRRLRFRHRTESYLRDRLTARTARWREEQVYQVEVRVLAPPGRAVQQRAGSLALRKAAVLDGTNRPALDALADAEIAWVHASLRARRQRILLHVLFVVLVVGALVQYLAWLSADHL